MAEKVLDQLPSKKEAAELILTSKVVKLKRKPIVQYTEDVGELGLKEIKTVDVIEMDFSPAFVPSWVGIEIGLLLVFFGLTRSSIPLYRVYTWLLGYADSTILASLISVLVSIIMMGAGVLLITVFDTVMLVITSKEGKKIRYLKNNKLRPQIEKFRANLMKRIRKK